MIDNKRNEINVFIINPISITVTITIFFLIFQSLFESLWRYFKYTDEVMAVVLFLSAVFRVIKHRIQPNKAITVSFVLVVTYLLLGTISSIVYKVQPLGISAAGAFLSVKWYLAFIGAYYLADLVTEEDKISIKLMTRVCCALFIVWAVLGFFGIEKNTILVWDVCAKTVFLLAILLMGWEKTITNYVYFILLLAILIATGKAKAYGAVVLAVFCLYWITLQNRKINIKNLFLLLVLLIVVASPKIYYYYILGAMRTFSRPLLLYTSFKVANDHFPLGTGWSSFGSYFSAKYYSQVYYDYGLNAHRELGVMTRNFIHDNYWPIVIAETGWLGLMIIIILCIMLFASVIHMGNDHSTFFSGTFLTLIYMLICTVEESGFQQPVLLCLAVSLGYGLGKYNMTREISAEDVC